MRILDCETLKGINRTDKCVVCEGGCIYEVFTQIKQTQARGDRVSALPDEQPLTRLQVVLLSVPCRLACALLPFAVDFVAHGEELPPSLRVN